jgi:hypothetical protein
MDTSQSMTCPACRAPNHERTCEEQFHALLFLEAAHMDTAGQAHHLMVLSYMFQHNGYSEETRRGAIGMFEQFLEKSVSPQEFRQQNKKRLGSDQRTFKITGSAGSDIKIDWPMTIMDIDSQDADAYVERVTEWARSILATVRAQV